MSGLLRRLYRVSRCFTTAVLIGAAAFAFALNGSLAAPDLTAQTASQRLALNHEDDPEAAQEQSPVRDALIGPRTAEFAPLAAEEHGESVYRYAVQDERVWVRPSVPEGTPSYELVFDLSAARPRITSFADRVEQYTEVSLLDEDIYPFAIEHLLLILPPTHPVHPCSQLDWSCEPAEGDDAVTEDSLRFTVEGTADVPGGFEYSFDLEITLQMPEAIPVLFEDQASEHGYELIEQLPEVPEDARFEPPEGFSRYEPEGNQP